MSSRFHFDVQAGGGRSRPFELRWARVTAAVERLTAAGATASVSTCGTAHRITS